MPKSSFIDFKAVKAAVTMEQLLSHYRLLEQFKKCGDGLSGPCPIHKGSNPTQFRVSIRKNIWNCFSECKGGGNVLDFIARMENVSIYAAALMAVEWFGLDAAALSARALAEKPVVETNKASPARGVSEPSKPGTTTGENNNVPNKPLAFRLEKLEREHPYFTERGLTPETIAEFGLGYCTKGMMIGRIAIPIQNHDGKVVAYAGRLPGEAGNDTPKYKLPPGFKKSLELFNIHRAGNEPAGKPLIIVEGFFDCMKLWQFGHRRVVALMGSTMSAAQEELLHKVTGSKSKVIIMLDEDEAGRNGRNDIALRLAEFLFVKVHVFPAPDTQPDQLTAQDVESILGEPV